MSKEDENELKQLFKDRAEEQKLLNERYKEWTDFRNQYRATFEPERRAESLARPGSEKKVDKYFREVEDDIENRFGVGRLAALDSLGKPFSKAVSAIAKFGYKHGSQALFVASLAAPFTIPVVGAMGAVGIQATAGGIWGTKAIMRKHEEWMEYGSPFSADDRIARTAWESGIYASHLTGRGSGAYPKSYDLAWKSQVMGTEYITRGLWVNEAGKLQSYNQGIWIPNETVPWFIRPVKGAIDSTGAALSIFQRRLSMRILNPGAYPSLPQFIMENPSYVGEVQKKIAYQYFQMFGSNEPFPAPKQAWEMSESRVVSLSMPYQEQAAYIRIMREYSPDPLRREIRQPPAFRTSGLAPMDAAIRRDVMRRNDELQMQKMSIAGALRRGHQDQLYSTGAK